MDFWGSRVMQINTWMMALLAFLSPLAMAADGVVSVDGLVMNESCSINGRAANGENDVLVRLPVVTSRALRSAGAKAGMTPFKVVLGGDSEAGCPNGRIANLHFEPGPTVTKDGFLVNEAAEFSGAQNVVVALFNKDGSDLNVLDLNSQRKTQAVITNNVAVLDYFAAYRATAVVCPGVVKSSVQYTVEYN